MTATYAAVAAAIVVLFVSTTLKAWSTFLLWDRHKPKEYWSDGKARSLFLVGKFTPLTACASIVMLAYATRLPWLEVPAWLFFGVVAYGVVTRITRARTAHFASKIRPGRTCVAVNASAPDTGVTPSTASKRC